MCIRDRACGPARFCRTYGRVRGERSRRAAPRPPKKRGRSEDSVCRRKSISIFYSYRRVLRYRPRPPPAHRAPSPRLPPPHRSTDGAAPRHSRPPFPASALPVAGRRAASTRRDLFSSGCGRRARRPFLATRRRDVRDLDWTNATTFELGPTVMPRHATPCHAGFDDELLASSLS